MRGYSGDFNLNIAQNWQVSVSPKLYNAVYIYILWGTCDFT